MNRVQITWQRRPAQRSADALRRVVSGCCERLGAGRCEIHILLTGDREIRTLNRDYLGHDRATDVLSFPDGDELPSGHRFLGEIVISLDTARRQAAEAGIEERRELEELALHGTLHLLGYDHVSDRGEMKRLELRMRRELLP